MRVDDIPLTLSVQPLLFNKRLERGLHAAAWLFFLLIYAFLFYRFLPFSASFLRGLGNILPLALLFYANAYLVNRFLERRRYRIYIIVVLALYGVFTVLRVQVNLFFPDFTAELFLQSERDSWRLGALATNFIALIISAFYQILSNNYRREQQNLAIIKEQREAELQFLRAQINPHFLFNTLNNIYSLAVAQSPKTAPMVMQLSRLLRYVIYDSQAVQVELSKEVKHIEQYVDLFQMRSEEPLDIRFSKSGDWQNWRLEPMILIPLVENCFKHCDFNDNPDAYVRLELKVSDNELRFLSLNTKNDQDRQKDRQGGVGLDNIRRRLALRYKNSFELEIKEEKEIFEVRLLITISETVKQ